MFMQLKDNTLQEDEKVKVSADDDRISRVSNFLLISILICLFGDCKEQHS